MWMQRPDVALMCQMCQHWQVSGQGQARSRCCCCCCCCSSAAPPVFHQRPQEQETATVARGTAQHSMQNPRAPRGHQQGCTTLASLASPAASLLSAPSPWGVSGPSCGWGKAVQGQLWVCFVLLWKVPPAEHVQEPGSGQGPSPHCLHCRTRRTPAATGSPGALRGARDCKWFCGEPTAKLSVQVQAIILPPF